jgi:pimeloyl-ACP methyl ester carboxylesterase
MTKGGNMKSIFLKRGFGTLFVLGLLIFLTRANDLSAASLSGEFKAAIKAIEDVPYNPRPVATDTADVTGISEAQSRLNFLANFTRVLIPAPANGKTFQASDANNAPDITLVGYMRLHAGPDPARPGIMLTHGGAGSGSIAQQGQFLIHIANVLFDNGYDVLAVDRRDGLLSRCAYSPVTLDPDPARSHPARVGGSSIQDCEALNNMFRDPSFTPNTLVSDFAGLGGDVLAAAKFLRDQTGTSMIGALGGSRGGLALIRAAAIQGKPGTDFPAGLIDAILVMSPVADDNTGEIASSSTTFSCSRVRAAEFYSGINGSGIQNFAGNPVGAAEDFFGLLDGVAAIENGKIPALIIQTLTDMDDATPIHGALAYKAKTAHMKLGHTLFMARIGHYHEMWQSDPYWADKVVLIYFKRLLAKNNSQIGDNPGFSSLGPNDDNPLIVHLRFKKTDAVKFLSQESIVPYLVAPCGL